MERVYAIAKTQYIDRRGSTRALKVKVGDQVFSIFTSPIHPLAKLEENTIYEYTGNRDFMEKFLEGILVRDYDYERGIHNEIIGIYFTLDGVELYIPIESADQRLESSPYSKLDLRESKMGTTYDTFKYHQALANLLKEYTLYTFSNKASEDDEIFQRDWYVVDPEWKWDEDIVKSKEFILYRPEIYSDEKLVYPSEKVAEACLSHLYAKLLTDKLGVLSVKDRKTFVNKFEYVQDFTPRPSEIVLNSITSLSEYISAKDSLKYNKKALDKFYLKTKEPYYYQNPNFFSGSLVLIQNVYVDSDDEIKSINLTRDFSYERAKFVVDEWIRNRINIGYFPDISLLDGKYLPIEKQSLYDYSNTREPFEIKNGVVVKYPMYNRIIYFAVLKV